MLLCVLCPLPVTGFYSPHIVYGAEQSKSILAATCLTKNFWQIYTFKEDGSSWQQLTHSHSDKSHLSWSRSQNELLANTNGNGLLIYTIDSGEGKTIPITTRGMTDAVWSADGGKILFSLSIADSIDANDIWLVSIASNKRRRLTNMKYMQHDPAWSRDEKQIIFVSGAGGQNHDLLALDLESGAIKQLTAGQRYHFEPACSVRNEIAFSSNRTDDYEIWVCDIEGKHFEQITHSSGLDGQPTWSPDGKQIAFVSARSGYPAVWVINRDGSNIHQLSPPGMKCMGPAWKR